MSEKAVYAEIKRIDAVAVAEARRVDGLFEAQETAVNAALVAQEKAVAAALAASEKAVNKAEAAQGNVNTNQNEFRGSLKDQAATLMPRSEAESIFRELRGLISAQAEVIGDLRSRLDVGPPSLTTLQARSDNDAGRRGGIASSWAVLIAVVGLILGPLVGLVIALTR